MIRQAVSCDMCGAEMQHANHWFVAVESRGELHISGWNPRGKPRAEARHLCGQTCLHKLMDEFVAGVLPVRNPSSATGAAVEGRASLPAAKRVRTAPPRPVVAKAPALKPVEVKLPAPLPQPIVAVHIPAYIDEFESSARLVSTPPALASPATPFPADSSSFAARNWHAEAWKRERERQQRSSEHRSRRRSLA